MSVLDEGSACSLADEAAKYNEGGIYQIGVHIALGALGGGPTARSPRAPLLLPRRP
jgi:hypothetical protein